MGAYLSKPLTDKESSSDSNQWISYGCSSMQGWRRFQEDAHNCILDYDSKRTASFFAVYDGHGGAEVAKYCSQHLPDFFLSQPGYSTEDQPVNPVNLLKKAFIDFDVTLTQAKAKAELKALAGSGGDDEDGDDDEDGEKPVRKSNGDADDEDNDENTVAENLEDISELHEEATRPIEAVLRKQFRGEIPDFIQNLLSFKKPGDAGPSVSASTSDTPSAEEPNGKSSPANESASGDVSKAGDEVTEKSEDQTAKGDTETGAQNVVGTEKESGKVEGTEDEVAAEEDEEDAEDEDYDAEKDDLEYYDEEEEDEEEEEEEEEDYYEGGDEGDDDGDEEGEEEAEASSVAVLPRPVGFNEPGVDSGSTACVAFLLPELSADEKDELVRRVFLYVANAGDSRAVLCRGGAAVELSEDHKPEDPPERARIQAAGGTVTADGRVNDGLNLSRAIGDHVYKQRPDLRMWDQMISALPDVTRTELMPGADEFVVIACDGIWNAMTSQAVVDFIYDRLHPELAPKDTKSSPSSEETNSSAKKTVEEVDGVEIIDRSSPAFLSKICEELFDSCLAVNTMGDGTGCDNMTCIILRFDDLKGLASQAVTRTTTQSPDDLSFLVEENKDGLEAANAAYSVQEGVEESLAEEEEEGGSDTSDRPPPIPIRIPVVTNANGNGEMDENFAASQHESDSSPTLSPAVKKARIDSSPKNGGSTPVEEVGSVE
ncbi:hypothetical protein Aperf_G00000121167 [Anoplocephala perfoliata]